MAAAALPLAGTGEAAANAITLHLPARVARAGADPRFPRNHDVSAGNLLLLFPSRPVFEIFPLLKDVACLIIGGRREMIIGAADADGGSDAARYEPLPRKRRPMTCGLNLAHGAGTNTRQ